MGTSSTKSTTDSTGESAPWAAQQPYLLDSWSDADNIFRNRLNSGAYGGDFVATDASGQQRNAFNQAYDWSGSQGKDLSNGLMGVGTQQLQTGVGNQSAALQGMGAFAGQDFTKNNLATAQSYMNPNLINSQVDAAMYDARQNAAENTLPNIYRQAAATGNINSDRTALAQGVVDRGLAEQASNVGSQITQNMWNQGLNQANTQNNQELSALGAQGSLGSNTAQQGYAGAGQGFNQYGAASQMQQGAAYGNNQLDQSVIDNGLKKWYNAYEFPQQALNDKYGIVGSNNWGSETKSHSTTETQQSPSMMQMMGQGLGLFGSLFCDIRHKVVLSGKIGEFRGFPTYFFVYRGDPSQTLHCGPMAQEVQAQRPDAIIERDGKLFINLEVL